MISKEEVKYISDKIFSLTDADEAEIIFYGGKLALTRFSEDRGITLSGYVMNTLGRIPEVGDSFVEENHEFTILKVEENRTESARIRRIEPEQ